MLRVAARNVNRLDAARRRSRPCASRTCAPARRSCATRRRRSRKDIEAHYDLGDDLFERMLDPSMMYSCALFDEPGMTLEQASTAQARADLREARPAADRPPARDRHRLGLARRARRPHARLPRDHDDDLQGPVRDRRPARARGGARGPRDGAARGLPRPHRPLRQARLGRDDRGRRLEGLRHVLRALLGAARARRRDAAAGDHDGRPRLPDRARTRARSSAR